MTSIIGALRDKITIERNTPVTDALGQPTQSWATLAANVWARVRPAGTARFDHEFMQARAETADADVVVEIRYRPDLTTEDRLRVPVHDLDGNLVREDLYDIQYVSDKNYRKKFTIILAKKGERYTGHA